MNFMLQIYGKISLKPYLYYEKSGRAIAHPLGLCFVIAKNYFTSTAALRANCFAFGNA